MTRDANGARELLALRYGTLASTKSALYHRYGVYGDPDAPQSLDYYLYAVRGRGETTVIDTGFAPAVGERRGRACLCPPLETLRRAGIDPRDVPRLVISHLHYDHIGNLGGFASATIHVPARELEFWTGPEARRAQFAEHVEPADIELIMELQAAGRVRTYTGPCVVVPGIEAVPAPGHSPGQHAFVVSTENGPVVLASDAIHLYEELEQDRPFAVVADLGQMYQSYDALRTLAEERDAPLVPGHDPLVVQRFQALDATTIRLTRAPVAGARA